VNAHSAGAAVVSLKTVEATAVALVLQGVRCVLHADDSARREYRVLAFGDDACSVQEMWE